ncbi:MAG: DMT family transporter [Pseudomonadota bacterium]
MSATQQGLMYCLAFVSLEAFQAVYLGAIFQAVDSFLVGAWVFGISVVACTLATALLRPGELINAGRAWRVVLALNLFAALTWVAYFTAVQLIEPAVVFTIFSGMVPIGAIVGAWLGLPEAKSRQNRFARAGQLTILASLLCLGTTTMLGFSGFAREGVWAALAGVLFAAISGGCTAFVILYSVRLNSRGVGPLAQFGLRFVLYTILALAAFWWGLDDKGVPLGSDQLAAIVLIGLAVIAFPLYLVQKAVPLIPAPTIAAMTALGPAMVFLMQLFDGRIDYSNATLAGLVVYMAGALLTVHGAASTAKT